MFDDGALRLSPDGAMLAIQTGDEIRLIDRTPKRELGVLAGRLAALFDREVWVARGASLVRYSLEFAQLAELELTAPGVGTRLTYGEPAVLWQAAPMTVVSATRDGLAATPLALERLPGERITAITAHRFARARRGQLAMLDASGRVRWQLDAGGGTDVLAAAPLLEGRWLASVMGRADAREHQLVLVDARDGRVQHRIALHGITAARFTSLRGLAVLRAEANHLVFVDLRFGKVVRHHEETAAVRDFAISEDGQRLVIELEGGGLVEANVVDMIAGRPIVSSPQIDAAAVEANVAAMIAGRPSDAAVVESPPMPEVPLAPAEPLAVPELLALAPRSGRATCSPDEVAALLAAARALVAAHAACAIATGWDSGAIAFVDEQRPPFEREVAALVLDVRGLASVQLEATRGAVELAEVQLAAVAAALGERVDPFTALADEIGLDAFERLVALLVAAPALWGELARVYGILANDEHRAVCDEQLLVQLCGGQREKIARALDRDRPLVRHGLVHVAGERARPYAALTIEPVVLRLLRGERIDADLDRGVEVAPPAPPLDELLVPRAPLRRLLAALAKPRPATRIVLRGRIGSGRRTLASALAAAADRRVGVVDAAPYLRRQSLDQLAAVLRRTALRGWVPLVDGLDLADTATLEMLREHPGPLVFRVARESTQQLPGDFHQLELASLSLGECAEHWRAQLARCQLAVEDVDALAARFRVGPGMIGRCVSSLGEGETIEQAMRRQLASRLGEVATRVERLPTWSQVVLPEDIHDSVLELIARVRFARTVYDGWGFDRIVTTARGVTALFQGPPGTGKTLVAGAIANELGLDLYRVDVSRVMSKWIGETEQNLAKVFAAAEESQAILLFDECDSLFAKRTEVKSSNDRYANTEVNYLLQRLDSFEGIAILTTNFGSSIDAAFKRRLSFRLTFPFPDDDTREQLWNAHLPPQLPRASTLDLADLARRFRMSGGYIRNAALRAAFLAAEERSLLTQQHLERAIRAEYREIGNLADSGVLA